MVTEQELRKRMGRSGKAFDRSMKWVRWTSFWYRKARERRERLRKIYAKDLGDWVRERQRDK